MRNANWEQERAFVIGSPEAARVPFRSAHVNACFTVVLAQHRYRMVLRSALTVFAISGFGMDAYYGNGAASTKWPVNVGGVQQRIVCRVAAVQAVSPVIRNDNGSEYSRYEK